MVGQLRNGVGGIYFQHLISTLFKGGSLVFRHWASGRRLCGRWDLQPDLQQVLQVPVTLGVTTTALAATLSVLGQEKRISLVAVLDFLPGRH